jgi:nitrogen fixation NifU-like protein
MNTTHQLRDIYRKTVLDHSRNPRNFKRLEPVDRRVEGHNPLCGDKITVYLNLSDEKIENLSFEGTGCAICMASASIMTESMIGKSLASAHRGIEQVLTDFQPSQDTPPDVTGPMAALAGVRDYPSRIKCATLAWKTLAAGIRDEGTTVTTED